MFEVEEHTADIRVRLRAASLDELFADGVRALMAVMKPSRAGERSPVTIELDAPDVTALLVDFLNEVLLRVQTHREAFEPESIVLLENRVVARLDARQTEGFEEDVKAVTYHEADVIDDNGMWSTTLVLDV